jgi:hypothetical protein
MKPSLICNFPYIQDEAKPNAPPTVQKMEAGETDFIKNMTGTDESV